jgi:hypothetical protein
MTAEAPKLIATPLIPHGFAVYCPHCKRHHYHGALGHKACHCGDPKSPYAKTGYELILEVQS